MTDTQAFILTPDRQAVAILTREGFDTSVPECVPIPRERLPVVEAMLAGRNFVVAFTRPEDRKKIVRGKWDKYDCGWGPDSFHTVGD